MIETQRNQGEAEAGRTKCDRIIKRSYQRDMLIKAYDIINI